jgi:hypothetical protein
MEVHHDGRRYWGTLKVRLEGCDWSFWSDHKWPFHHGHFTQRRLDRKEALQKFFDWLPFEMTS